MHRTAHHSVLAVALAAVLALSSSCSSEDDPVAEPTPSAGASVSTSASGSAATTSPHDVAVLLGRNLEAMKKATGAYPKGGSQDYRNVVGIDQADGYTVAYSVDGAGRMIVCVSDGGTSASYSSRDHAVTDGGGHGCGL